MSKSNNGKQSTKGVRNKDFRSNNRGKGGYKPSREQPRKDSGMKRINYDNTRIDKFERDMEKGSRMPSANNITDFTANAELLKAAGSLPFATILGNGYGSQGATVPGVMTFFWYPCLGTGRVPYALNKAFNQQYSFLVHANSRNYTYNAPDLAVSEIAGINVFAALASVRRAYGIVKYYAEQNRYYPDALLGAMGFVPEDFRANLGNIWFDMNNLIAQTKQIWVPNIMPLVSRWFDKNSYIYTDGAGIRAQSYMYVQAAYYIYNETAMESGGCLTMAPAVEYSKDTGEYTIGSTFEPGYNTSYPWSTWKATIEYMIKALVDSQDRGVQYGDILKAYGPEKIFAMSEIPADYKTGPVYNAEVLSQIENITMISPNLIPTMYYQDQEDVSLRPAYAGAVTSAQATGMGSTQILNFPFANQPSPEAIVIATRGKAGMPKYATGVPVYSAKVDGDEGELEVKLLSATNPGVTGYVLATTLPSEPIVGCQVLRYNANSNELVQEDLKLTITNAGNLPAAAMGRLMAFDWHPFVYLIDASTINSARQNNYLAHAYGDFDNWIEINDSELEKLNDMCFYSLYGMPHVGL